MSVTLEQQIQRRKPIIYSTAIFHGKCFDELCSLFSPIQIFRDNIRFESPLPPAGYIFGKYSVPLRNLPKNHYFVMQASACILHNYTTLFVSRASAITS